MPIKGLPVVLNNFDKLTMKDVIVNAAEAGAEVIREQASQNAPRDTGRLSRLEITKAVVKSQNRAVIKIGPAKDVFYGLFLELGTVHMAPRPFLGPALDAKAPEAITETSNVIQFALNAKVH